MREVRPPLATYPMNRNPRFCECDCVFCVLYKSRFRVQTGFSTLYGIQIEF